MEAMLGSGMGMCRCCATEGTFKGLTTSFLWMGEQEIYLEMLRDCLDVTLEIPEEGPECGICEVCITQLRSAVNFKRQVLNTERQFQRMLENNAFPPKLVKEELSMEADEDDIPLSHLSDDDHAQSEGFSSPEYDVAIKAEKADEKKPRKRAKPGSSRGKLADAEPPAKRIRRKTAKLGNLDTSVSKNRSLTKSKTAVKNESKEDQKFRTTKNKNHVLVTEDREIDKHLHNIRQILLNTNGTPIKSYNGFGYTCCFCFDAPAFSDLDGLKAHTLQTHGDEEKIKFGEKSTMATYTVKLDITGFQCSLCKKDINSVEDMITHLSSEHKKEMFMDIDNHILPFKFEDGVFRCVLCPITNEYYKVMLQHMNSHSSNYYCQICGATFVIERALTTHMNHHLREEYPCQYCSEVFDTGGKRKVHERATHGLNKIHKCTICLERFESYHRKVVHMVKQHDAPKTFYKCEECDKTFTTKSILCSHKRKAHLLERKHKCDFCTKTFFSSFELKKHTVKHTGVKEFQCMVCKKFFGRASSLQTHMRIHLNERRFKCDLCSRAFVHKVSWKNHTLTRHGFDVNVGTSNSGVSESRS